MTSLKNSLSILFFSMLTIIMVYTGSYHIIVIVSLIFAGTECITILKNYKANNGYKDSFKELLYCAICIISSIVIGILYFLKL